MSKDTVQIGKGQYENIELGNLLFGHSRGSYAVNRDEIQPKFYEFFDRFGIDIYGNVDAKSPFSEMSKYDGKVYRSIDNDIFSISPYYWGDDEDVASAPNFLYKPEEIEIRWYKYCMRDAYSNVPLTKELVEKMLGRCASSAKR